MGSVTDERVASSAVGSAEPDAVGSAEPDEVPDDLLKNLADDLAEGFAQLVRRYQHVMYSVALRVSGRPAEAEDLTAEALLRAYRRLRDYDRERVLAMRLRPWLLTILLNTWRNSIRDESRRPSHVLMGDLPERPAGERPVEEQIESQESQRELAGLLLQLSHPQRIAVVLRHVVGLPISDIAVVLDCAEGTAKSHISRGLSALRGLYAQSSTGYRGPARKGCDGDE